MIRQHIDDKIVVLTIDRPDKANSLTGDMLRDLTGRFEELAG